MKNARTVAAHALMLGLPLAIAIAVHATQAFGDKPMLAVAFKGTGITARPTLSVDGPEFVKTVSPLTAAQKSAKLVTLGAGTSKPGAIYWKLTAASPSNARGALVFMRPYLVEGQQGWVHWQGSPTTQPEKGAAIWLKSEGAGKKYLIDCSLRAKTDIIVTSTNGFKQTTALAGGKVTDVHVTFVADTQDDRWYGFNLYSMGPSRLYSCEATTLI